MLSRKIFKLGQKYLNKIGRNLNFEINLNCKQLRKNQLHLFFKSNLVISEIADQIIKLYINLENMFVFYPIMISENRIWAFTLYSKGRCKLIEIAVLDSALASKVGGGEGGGVLVTTTSLRLY